MILVLNDFRNRILIANEEEAKLGIPEDRQGMSAVAQNAYHAWHMQSLSSIRDGHSDWFSPEASLHSFYKYISSTSLSRHRHIVKELLLQRKNTLISLSYFLYTVLSPTFGLLVFLQPNSRLWSHWSLFPLPLICQPSEITGVKLARPDHWSQPPFIPSNSAKLSLWLGIFASQTTGYGLPQPIALARSFVMHAVLPPEWYRCPNTKWDWTVQHGVHKNTPLAFWSIKSLYDMAAPFGCNLEEDTDDVDADTGNLNEVEDTVNIPTNSSSQVPVLGVGEGPLLDLEDHAAIEETAVGRESFTPSLTLTGKKSPNIVHWLGGNDSK